MNANKYIDLLDNILIWFMEKKHGDVIAFQRDNAPTCNSKRTEEWFAQKDFPLVK